MTFTPFAMARLSAGATAFGSLPEMMIAFAPCWTAVLMNDTCAVADAAVGPLYVTVSPSCFPAALAPAPFSVNTGIPMNFGIRNSLYEAFASLDPAVPTPAATAITATAAATTATGSIKRLLLIRTLLLRLDGCLHGT